MPNGKDHPEKRSDETKRVPKTSEKFPNPADVPAPSSHQLIIDGSSNFTIGQNASIPIVGTVKIVGASTFLTVSPAPPVSSGAVAKTTGTSTSFVPPPGQITDQDRANAQCKLSDPSKFPHMTAREVAAALGISIKAVYEHPRIEEFPTGIGKRLWTTRSVLALINSPPPQ